MNRLLKLFSGKIAKNASWLIGGNIAQKLMAFLIGIWTARYLGPSNYGLINYAAAYTTFFFSLSTLGINSVLVKEFIDEPEHEGATLGTTLVLQCVASLCSIACIFLIVSFLDFGETQTIIVVVLCSLGLFFQAFDSVRFWFQARLESKYAAIATLIAYAITSLYKIVLLIRGMSVEWFAVATSVDYVSIALILLFAYRRKGGAKLTFSFDKAKSLLSKSHHFILSGLMVSIYGATDRLMLKQMLDEAAVGYYGTAVSVCNIWVFVLGAIIESFIPVIMQRHSENQQEFEKKCRQLYAIVFYLSVFVSTVLLIFGSFVIRTLYGEAFMGAVAPLRIVTWYTAFSYLGCARDSWIVCEQKQRYLKYLYAGAAVTNVVINALLIPAWGASGAATASLITQVSTILIFPAWIKELRPNVKLILDAMRLKGISAHD